MKRINEKILLVYIMILGYLIMTISISETWFVKSYNMIINPICWIAIFLFCKFSLDGNTRTKKGTEIFKSVLTMAVLYLIIYFTTGLFVGFGKNPLSMEPSIIIKNIWAFVVILFFQEYIRSVLVNYSNKKKYIWVAISILFAIVEINFTVLNNIASNAEMFKYVSRTIIPAVAGSFLFTFLVRVGGYKSSLAYRIPVTLSTVVLPILPNYDWFMTSISQLLVIAIIYIYVSYFYSLSDRRQSRRAMKKNNPTGYIPVIIFTLLLTGFVGGFFKYQPIAVMSNSMYPYFQRGDAVIIEKIDEDSLKNLKKGTIIEYILDNRVIIHRIDSINTTKNGQVEYVTKGDNNNTVDFKKVSPNQIVGVVRGVAPKIGYPSVWFSEMIN